MPVDACETRREMSHASMATPPVRSAPGSPAALEAALRAWAEAIGERHTDAADAARDRYGRTTGTRGVRPLAVLYPDSTAQVREILRIASRYGIGVYPISRGKNWGYGDACPVRENNVVVDLGRMNRIVEVNPELCYAVVEPGVTQGQLYRHLTENRTGLWMDCTAAGLDASIVGNTLDRGFGHTRYGDHFLTTCGMEVVLADGRVLNTGFTHYPHAKAGRVYRYGVGPYLDGIFSQSNFGIVTQAGIWLMPEPEDFLSFFISAPGEADLPALLDRLVPLRMQGLLQSAVHIANDLRGIAGKMRYPWERAGGKTPLPRELREQLRRENSLGAWNACGAIYGTRETVAATRRVLRRALGPYRVTFLNDRTLRAAERVQRALRPFGLCRRLGEKLECVKPVYGLLKGVPTNDLLRGAAWRVRGPLPAGPAADPLDCHAGLMWIAPTLPASGAAARDLMSRIEPIYERHGFETLVTFTMITERALCCVTNVAFDRRDSDEAARAAACYEELTDVLMSAGYIFYRAGPAAMGKLADGSSGFWEVAGQLKHALDPQGIISPGRYHPLA